MVQHICHYMEGIHLFLPLMTLKAAYKSQKNYHERFQDTLNNIGEFTLCTIKKNMTMMRFLNRY